MILKQRSYAGQFQHFTIPLAAKCHPPKKQLFCLKLTDIDSLQSEDYAHWDIVERGIENKQMASHTLRQILHELNHLIHSLVHVDILHFKISVDFNFSK